MPVDVQRVFSENVGSVQKPKFSEKCTTNGLHLLRKHAFYMQIITQEVVTKASYSDLVVWSPRDFHMERIFPDPSFASVDLEKLRVIHFIHMLPACITSLRSR